ncbi:Protein CHROMATIN REMODELING 20 [Choanephora cucurbitarum]|uniref:Protein CHROMATIN REMODELING 20 n=1 Tax=Choanephora cucurbitarum TaxID=101091 RepID=A0A1C7NDZ9_9FUNG|nr:Protein CHROMATIN REMODELING 20 [Choanephora cucurbitarum]
MEKILNKIVESEAIDAHTFKKRCVLPSLDAFHQFQHDSKRRKLQEFLDDYHSTSHKSLSFEETDNIQALEQIDFALDPYYRTTLKSHQLEGLKFMWDRMYRKKSGCLLSHAMGLGKTLQVIALLSTIYQHRKRYPSTQFPSGNRVLILAPVVTLSNWVEEFAKWSVNDMDDILGEVYNFSSIKSAGKKSRERQLAFVLHWYTYGGVMLLGYEQFRTLMQDKLEDNTNNRFMDYLIHPGPDIVVLDEGHRIKNASTALASLVSQFHTPLRLCLTGYPLQNHLSEYYYMIHAITPGLLGTPEHFKSYFSNLIENCFHDSSAYRKREAAMKMYVLQLLAGEIMHRRDESILIKTLPKKTEYLIKFKLSPIQHKGYMFLLQHVVDGLAPLLALLILRALCDHPRIFENLLEKRLERKRQMSLRHMEMTDEDVSHPVIEEHQEDEERLLQLFDFDAQQYEQLSSYFKTLDTESWSCAGKMTFIANLAVASKAVQDKLVIVSHSLSCLDYLEHFLPVLGIKMARIDGDTAGNSRQGIINSFTEDKEIHVMLLTAKAAGIGINLVAANRIVLVDQDWNPLYDEQSIGRIYRIGQTKPVYVYRLVTATTIEESIMNQSVHKNSISRRVIDNNRKTASISRDELKQYFQPPNPDIELIDLKTMDREVLEDPVSNSLYAKNESIVHAKVYQSDSSEEPAWFRLSERDRQTAKRDVVQYKRKNYGI